MTIIMKKLIFIVTAFLLLGLSNAYAEETCQMCHPEKAEGKSVHPAVAMGCTSCHANVNAADIPHKMPATPAKGLTAEGADLCYQCHSKDNFTGKSTHMPVTGGMCTSCHSPHSSQHNKLLLSEFVCFDCHDKQSFSGMKFVHAPVAAGMCVSCHMPHKSANDKLLISQAPELCYTCHQKEQFYGATVHSPVAMGMCTSCHSPHQSDIGKLTTLGSPDLCYQCHDQAKFKMKSTHKPVAEGRCTLCHEVHASANEALVYRKGNILCRKCHAKIEQEPHAVAGFSQAGHPVRGRKDPKREGKTFGCLSCHVPHASEWGKLYRYPGQVAFDLCSNCHNM